MFALPKFTVVALTCLVSISSSTPANPTVTAPPIIAKREPYDLDDFIGYYATSGVSSSSYAASTCSGTLYRKISVTSSGYFGGCESSSYYSAFTQCSGSVAQGIYSYVSGTYAYSATSSTCTGVSSCITDKIKYSPSEDGISFFIRCADTTPRTIYYTDIEALPVLQAITSSTASSSTTSAPSVSRVTITQTPSVSPSPTRSAQPHKHKSKAGPIAGGVVGGIAVLSLIVFLIWFFLKKRHLRKLGAAGSSEYAQSQPVMVQQQPGHLGEPNNFGIQGKTAMPSASPVSPYPQQVTWTPAMGGNPGISPPTSPPPTYFPQPQPMHSHPQSQPILNQ
ncbi:hypothetical protein VTL71DRAFT_16119 [Oculimacula yallundae]|uniref:Uncharacterized protein n=1 Tax=Oculimacula yallundae TaxID=86028 RepID=A0ABR4CDJ2_9HELO